MKLLHKSFNMLALATLLALAFGVTSCSDDEPGEGTETNIPEKGNGKDFVFDDAGYFEDNFFGFDETGSSFDRKLGKAIDPNEPKHLYVGAESPEEAKELFLRWLAPGYEEKISTADDGTITYSPTDATGKPQGQIIYRVDDDGYKFGTVTFSKDTPIETFHEVTIIRRAGFPDNDEDRGDFIVEGDFVGARAWAKDPDSWPFGGLVGLVIRKTDPERGKKGFILFITPKINGRNPIIDQYAPSVRELGSYVSNDICNSAVIIGKPVSYLENLINELGITLKVEGNNSDSPLINVENGFYKTPDEINFSFSSEFWSSTKDNRTFAAVLRRYTSDLNGHWNWYAIQKPWNPEKRLIFFRYYD